MSLLTPAYATPSSAVDEPFDPSVGRRRGVWFWLRRDPAAMLGLSVIVILTVAAIVGPWFTAPSNQIQMMRKVNGAMLFAPFSPSSSNFFGTDQLGRDIFGRVLLGLRTSLFIGVVVRGITIVAGTLLGLVAGYAGSLVDAAIMRIVDILMAFPVILLAMAITAVLGPSLTTLCLALVFVSWPDTARLVRGQVLSLRNLTYIEAARAVGAGRLRLLLRYLLPNCLDPIIVSFSMGIPGAIMYEAGLSFFGFGIQPPTPSLGSLIADGRGYITTAWWWPLFPGLVLMLLTVSFNLLGDGLTRAFDPQAQKAGL